MASPSPVPRSQESGGCFKPLPQEGGVWGEAFNMPLCPYKF